ncbi:MAG: hypothetical protein WA324_14330 [Bryobacteraceae bacterium]
MIETKIFDPADGFGTITDVWVATDSTLMRRGRQWWMYLAGKIQNREGIDLFSASLPDGAPLSATGWTIMPDANDPSKAALLAGYERSHSWDLKGGRHCPSYVKGWDPARGDWVERIYYAGGAENVWGPYTIGYLEWDGRQWIDQASPVFLSEEEWEHGSVYEPNLVYADGKWKMWYVAGSNQEDYLVHGFSESVDGCTNWTKHKIFAPPDHKMFDFCVIKAEIGFEAVFSRVWLTSSEPPPVTGLWWCRAGHLSAELSDWSEPIQIMTAENRGWHGGPWKPSLQYSETGEGKMLVFFDGAYKREIPGGFPFVFTLGCLQIDRPE